MSHSFRRRANAFYLIVQRTNPPTRFFRHQLIAIFFIANLSFRAGLENQLIKVCLRGDLSVGWNPIFSRLLNFTDRQENIMFRSAVHRAG